MERCLQAGFDFYMTRPHADRIVIARRGKADWDGRTWTTCVKRGGGDWVEEEREILAIDGIHTLAAGWLPFLSMSRALPSLK